MGAGISQEQIQAHLSRQEALIKQLQTVVEKQSKALESMGTGVNYDAPERVGDQGHPHIMEDLDGLREHARRAERKTHESVVTPEESKQAHHQWTEPTDEEERGFMATKPWLGAMAMPDGFQYGVTDGMPDIKLELEHVYGYRSSCVCNNVAFVDANTVVYFAAAVGIVHDIPRNKQSFFIEHNDDVTCLAYHKGRNIVVTGEMGKTPAMCVWDPTSRKLLAKLAGFHKRSVVSVAFSADGSKIASVGLDDEHSIAVYDWASGALVASSKGDTNRIIDCFFNTTKESDANNEFVTVGVNHIKFWTLAGGALTEKAGLLGNLGEKKPFLTVAFTTLYTCVGTSGGEIYVFKGNKLQKVVDAHQQTLSSLKAIGDTVFSGGKDGFVSRWNMNTFKKEASVSMNKYEAPEVLKVSTNGIRAIDILDEDNIVVGCLTSTIYTVKVSNESVKNVIKAHYGDLEAKQNYGELWGMATSPNSKVIVSCAEDSTLRLWDMETRLEKLKIFLRDKGQSVAWSPNGKFIAAGLQNGLLCIYNAANLEEIKSMKKCKRRLQCVRFSPCSKYLAVGSADNVIDLYDCEADFQFLNRAKGNSSVILHLDFSEDSKYIQSCAQSYELLFYNTPGCEQHVKSRELKNTKWATFSSILGWNVQGIWPAEADGSDVNQVNKSNNSKYLATAEDSGLVKIFNYPCVGGGLDKNGALVKRPQSYRAKGHSSHVTSVDWTHEDSYVVSAGGADNCLFQWKVVKA